MWTMHTSHSDNDIFSHQQWWDMFEIQQKPDVFLISDWEQLLITLLENIEREYTEIYIQMYIWKNDDVWMRILHALLRAAKRWVKVYISKDRGGRVTEWPNSLFHGYRMYTPWSMTLSERIAHSFLWLYEEKNEGNDKRQSFYDSLCNHENITVDDWVRNFYRWPHTVVENNHSKFVTFGKKKFLVMTSNFSDEMLSWWDIWALVTWPSAYNALSQAVFEPQKFLPSFWIDVAVNTTRQGLGSTFVMDQSCYGEKVLKLFDEAEEHICIQVPYRWDKKILRKIKEKAKSWVRVNIMVPLDSDVQHDLNYKVMNELYRSAYADNIDIYFTSKMCHAKYIVTDKAFLLWSWNLNRLSLRKMWETSLIFQRDVYEKHYMKMLSLFESRLQQAKQMNWLVDYNACKAFVESLQ